MVNMKLLGSAILALSFVSASAVAEGSVFVNNHNPTSMTLNYVFCDNYFQNCSVSKSITLASDQFKQLDTVSYRVGQTDTVAVEAAFSANIFN